MRFQETLFTASPFSEWLVTCIDSGEFRKVWRWSNEFPRTTQVRLLGVRMCSGGSGIVLQ